VASATVNTKVENTGLGVAAALGHSSNVAPIGKQNRGTEVGKAKLRRSVVGYLNNTRKLYIVFLNKLVNSKLRLNIESKYS
jgi:hypothetical protein